MKKLLTFLFASLMLLSSITTANAQSKIPGSLDLSTATVDAGTGTLHEGAGWDGSKIDWMTKGNTATIQFENTKANTKYNIISYGGTNQSQVVVNFKITDATGAEFYNKTTEPYASGGFGDKKKNALKTVESFPKEPDFENSCDSSEVRYHYYYKKRLSDTALQTTDPSINWGKQSVRACARVTSRIETAKIKIPVLLIQAGNDTVVKNASQDLFASRVKKCELYRVPDMKHELYMTDSHVLIPYWKKIFSFLG